MNRTGASRSGLAALLLALAVPGCTTGSPQGAPRPPAPAPAPVVEVSLTDFRVEIREAVPAGRVVFQMTNAGQSVHNVILIPVPDELPPIEEQIRGSQRRLVEPYAGMYDRAPGDTGTFAVNLFPGKRYAILCTMVGEDGEGHSKKGMAVEFRVGEPAGKR